ncbi:NACHT domain-containing NTPase [[Phormidium] sp. ETS-05]|uniref:NACHT domain-containing protein n=1 Tax=[Phormidium] sp. ETS-05 TaxID=222819 RepID=UPI001E3154B5|nr:NACHT domain-containing protein [[Phormidium] sp. ETS-05]
MPSHPKVLDPLTPPPSDLEGLVEQVRELLRIPLNIEYRHLPQIDSSPPLTIDETYIPLAVLDQISSQRWLEVADLQRNHRHTVGGQHRLSLNQTYQNRIPALEAISDHLTTNSTTNSLKLMLLGKPGAGKTTFLQYLTLQCLGGELFPGHIPLLFRLRDWSATAQKSGDFDLINYISQKLHHLGINAEQITTLLHAGRVFLLLDGWDEINPSHSSEIGEQISQFSETYYQNSVVVSSRLAADHYRFRGFTYVELADFDGDQIAAFVFKWFAATCKANPKTGTHLAAQFMEKLDLPENSPMRELAGTPILLTLMVSVFFTKADFPKKRSKLYEAGLDILLSRWDEARGIQRHSAYDNLSLPHKIKLLSAIAAETFPLGNYFFEQSEIEAIVSDQLAIWGGNVEPETSHQESAAVLKAIELQHGLLVERAKGIYSFSHLSFQEYFTARNIVYRADAQMQREAIQELAAWVGDSRWREVFLLTAEMLRNADPLLQAMKLEIDTIAASSQFLQEFLAALATKCHGLEVGNKPAALRAFYFTLFLDRDLGLALALDRSLAGNLTPELNLDLKLARIFALALTLTREEIPDNPSGNKHLRQQMLNLNFALDLNGNLAGKPQLETAILQLKAALPDLSDKSTVCVHWWQQQGSHWLQEFAAVLQKHRQLVTTQLFTPEQIATLRHYYQTNKLLMDCLTSDCNCSIALKADIAANLLLPPLGTPEPKIMMTRSVGKSPLISSPQPT